MRDDGIIYTRDHAVKVLGGDPPSDQDNNDAAADRVGYPLDGLRRTLRPLLQPRQDCIRGTSK